MDRSAEFNAWLEAVEHVSDVLEAIRVGVEHVDAPGEPAKIHALAEELQAVAERYGAYLEERAGEADSLADLPPFPPLGASDRCMFCGGEIADRQSASAVTVRPEWQPRSFLHYSAHDECLHRTAHPDTPRFAR